MTGIKLEVGADELATLRAHVEALKIERDTLSDKRKQLSDMYNRAEMARGAAVHRAETAEADRDALRAENARLRDALEKIMDKGKEIYPGGHNMPVTIWSESAAIAAEALGVNIWAAQVHPMPRRTIEQAIDAEIERAWEQDTDGGANV